MCLIGNDLLCINANKITFSRKDADKIIINKFETNTFFFKNITTVLPIIWTIKESVYKITCKQGYNKAFSPTNYTITSFNSNDSNINGTIYFENQNYYFKTIIKNNYIFSFATIEYENILKVKHKFFINELTNNNCLNNITFINFIKSNNWSIVHTKNGIPIITNYSNIDISITHDFNILALSYLNTN